jgi:hypothetical protein
VIKDLRVLDIVPLARVLNSELAGRSLKTGTGGGRQ